MVRAVEACWDRGARRKTRTEILPLIGFCHHRPHTCIWTSFLLITTNAHRYNGSQVPTRVREGSAFVGIPSRLHLDRWIVSQPCDVRSLMREAGLTICHSNAHYSPHSHGGLTTHLILKGQLTITFPQDETPEKKTYGVGDRIDVEAGRVHEVWMGSEGCTYVIGE